MIRDFLTLHRGPFLLGLSGGPDSIALFHLLLEAKQPFEAAHLDHGWRPESRQEAVQLAEICQNAGIRYHLKRVELTGPNLEDVSRKARHTFFEEICATRGLEGVLLAHHADDQAETVLKRLFEGASLPKLRGLASKTQVGNLILYRPLLNVHKKDILEWLDNKEISYFLDPTNEDERFLRNRMRKTLLPTLSNQFGKRIEPSLCRIAEAAEELSCYLQDVLKSFQKQVIENEEFISLDFQPFLPQSPFILKAVIRDLFENEKLALPKAVLETILLHIQKNSAHKTIRVGQNLVNIHRGLLTIKRLKLF